MVYRQCASVYLSSLYYKQVASSTDVHPVSVHNSVYVVLYVLSLLCASNPQVPGAPGEQLKRGSGGLSALAPAAPLPFTAPHMVLQRWVPRGLLALHHPGLGPATRPLSPPVSPLRWGSPSPLSPLYLFSCHPLFLLIIWIMSRCEPRTQTPSFCCLLLTHIFPSPFSVSSTF